jgi:hypothetical protein
VNNKIYGITPNESKFYSGKNYEQTEVWDCLLSFGAVSFVFQFAIQKCNDYNTQTITLLVVLYGVKLDHSHWGRNAGQGHWEMEVEENIWT